MHLFWAKNDQKHMQVQTLAFWQSFSSEVYHDRWLFHQVIDCSVCLAQKRLFQPHGLWSVATNYLWLPKFGDSFHNLPFRPRSTLLFVFQQVWNPTKIMWVFVSSNITLQLFINHSKWSVLIRWKERTPFRPGGPFLEAIDFKDSFLGYRPYACPEGNECWTNLSFDI